MFDGDDRTEFPTPRRLEEARSAGSVPRSLDLCAAVVLLAVSLLLLCAGPVLWRGALQLWNGTEASSSSGFSLGDSFEQSALQLACVAAGVLGLACLAAVLANVAQFGFRVTPDVVRLRWSRVHPGTGFTRLGSGGFLTAAFLLKVAGVFAVLAWSVVDSLDVTDALPASDGILTLGAAYGTLLTTAGARVSVVLLILALADLVWQRRRFFTSLRMTRQEVLDQARGAARRRTPTDGRLRPFPPVSDS
jgi:flagellar biosynthetic protein FlhB